MSQEEKQAFAERLKLALRRSARTVDTPTVLALQFNLRHPNSPITPQAAMNWLSGKSKPTADKIKTLAEWLDVSPHWLSYGSPEPRPSQRQERPDPVLMNNLSSEEQTLINRYRVLSRRRQQMLVDLALEFGVEQEVWPDGAG